MRTRRPKASLPRLSRDAERLVTLAQGLFASGNHLEKKFWEQQIQVALVPLLEAHKETLINSVLNYLQTALPGAYESLLDSLEMHAESVLFEHEGNLFQALLVAVPILAWSRYVIPGGKVTPEVAEVLALQLKKYIAAQDVKLTVLPYLFSIDQLPQQFSDVRSLTRALVNTTLSQQPMHIDSKYLLETAPLPADSRYMLSVLIARDDAPLFCWQELNSSAVNREQTLERWRSRTQAILQPLLPGCTIELLLPDAYHASCRESDLMIRPYSIQAALAFLENVLQTPAQRLRAVIAGFGDEHIEEYRIGFAIKNTQDILHGIVWPLYGLEQNLERESHLEKIEVLLRLAGIGDVTQLSELFPMEYCDDCGAPLFAEPLGELTHAEFPEDIEAKDIQLH